MPVRTSHRHRRIPGWFPAIALLALCVGAPAFAADITPGTYVLVGGDYSITIVSDGSSLMVREPNKTSVYNRVDDDEFHFWNPNTQTTYGLRFVDARTIEAFKPGVPGNVPSRLALVPGTEGQISSAATTEIIGELQSQELARQQEEAEADAEFEAERARKAAAWDAMKAANEQALAESIARANESAARNQAMLDAHYRQLREQGQGQPSVDAMQRAAELENARQATQRQYEIARQFEARQQAQREAAAMASASSASASSAGSASTRDDTSTCVSAPVIGPNPNPAVCTDGYSASITNACTAPVKVRLCAMTSRGWDCSSNGGVAPGGSWSQAWCHAQPGTFVSSRYADSPEDPDRP